MKGDFSQWRFNPGENFAGVLQQQGKVMLDSDWNEHTRITTHWQDQAGRDAIGPDVAAVPTGAPEGFKAVAARVVTGSGSPFVEVDLSPGRVWADGLLAYLPPASPTAPTAPVTRRATYLSPPIQTPAATPPTAAQAALGVRDAIVLEVWREALHGFQSPTRLLEPALGGVDTTERILTSYALRLLRLADGEDCVSIHGKLKDDPSLFGRLTAKLTPTTTVAGECPVVQGGGYVGLEHRLYRIEIAHTDDATPRFKWSQWNGGLVGAGVVHTSGTALTIDLDANRTAILTSGLTSCYLEIVSFDPDLGHWRVSYGAPASINPNGTLEIDTTQKIFGAPPPDPSADPTDDPRSFFRLWNGIELLGDYLNVATPKELPDELGVHVSFESPAGKVYRPGDYWTFTVRAGDIGNADTLLSAALPAGIHYHRVPLGIITWPADLTAAGDDLHDCRRRFRPLSRLDTCCTHRVGDGHTSLGDYTSIQAAIDALPDEGGEVCLLPGDFHENIVILNRDNITISGCGPRTRLFAATEEQTEAVISILGGRHITVESLAVVAAPRSKAILALGRNPFDKNDKLEGPLEDLTLAQLDVSAAAFAAIRAEWIQGLVVRGCALHMEDTHCAEQALVVLADDALIERNLIEVTGDGKEGFSRSPDEDQNSSLGAHSKGGLHLKSLCERVRGEDNRIRGGSSNGITLGSLMWVDKDDNPVDPGDEPEDPEEDPCEPSKPVTLVIISILILVGEYLIRPASGGPLYEIAIRRNRISSMGTNGIGVVGFFDLSEVDEFISVAGLQIEHNRIHDCLRRTLTAPPEGMAADLGYGGIALGDVENLVIRGNTIVDNGRTHVDPVCGIFILHVEGADLTNNRIVNNGARFTAAAAAGIKHGQRGGIVIRFAVPLTVLVDTLLGTAPQQNGVPAVRLHDNTVSTPFGRALTLTVLGPVSIVANQFTSQGIPAFSTDITGLFAGAVLIFNLGISNDLFYLQQLLFALFAKTNGQKYLAGAAESTLAQEGLDDQRLGSLLANGQVIFNDNQVNLDLLARGVSLSLSSILIFTLDDLSFAGNQCEANLLDDLLATNLFSVAMTQRVSGNRFKEGILNAPLSAFTLGVMMNTTTDNQGTHCIVARNGVPSLLVEEHNKVLIQAFMEGFCEGFSKFLSGHTSDPAADGQLAGASADSTAVAHADTSNVLTLLR